MREVTLVGDGRAQEGGDTFSLKGVVCCLALDGRRVQSLPTHQVPRQGAWPSAHLHLLFALWLGCNAASPSGSVHHQCSCTSLFMSGCSPRPAAAAEEVCSKTFTFTGFSDGSRELELTLPAGLESSTLGPHVACLHSLHVRCVWPIPPVHESGDASGPSGQRGAPVEASCRWSRASHAGQAGSSHGCAACMPVCCAADQVLDGALFWHDLAHAPAAQRAQQAAEAVLWAPAPAAQLGAAAGGLCQHASNRCLPLGAAFARCLHAHQRRALHDTARPRPCPRPCRRSQSPRWRACESAQLAVEQLVVFRASCACP